jgi:hypothetical protein
MGPDCEKYFFMGMKFSGFSGRILVKMNAVWLKTRRLSQQRLFRNRRIGTEYGKTVSFQVCPGRIPSAFVLCSYCVRYVFAYLAGNNERKTNGKRTE